jgi:hypothetical protein
MAVWFILPVSLINKNIKTSFMNRNEKKGKDRDAATDTEPLSNDRHNPFKDTEVNQNTQEPTQDEEAIAEQQRKEALTERD